MSLPPRHATTVLVIACLCLAGASLLVGDGSLAEPDLRAAFLTLRAWRTAGALLAGAALAMAGVVVQGLFHNPLASPDVLGTTAGATLGGQAALLGWSTVAGAATAQGLAPELVVPLGSLLGSWVALLVVQAAARRLHDRLAILLAGVLLSTVAVSLGAMMTSLAMESWEVGRALVAFTLGGLDGLGSARVLGALPWVVVGGVATRLLAPELDVLLSGDDEAAALGVDVAMVRRWGIAWVAVLAAAATFVGGQVPFVGLVVPHLARRWLGPVHGKLLPAAALGGAAFVLVCDIAVRMVPAIGAIPLGAVTGLVGAPVFFTLLERRGAPRA